MKFYTLKQIFNLIILLCSPGEACWMGVTWGRGRTHQHATRLPGGEGATIHTRRYLCVQHIPPSAAQVAADRDNKARACPARKPEKYFSFRQLPLPRHRSPAFRSFSIWAACPANCQKSLFKRAAQLGFFFMRFQLFHISSFFFVRSLQKCFSSPGCTCCAGSSYVAGFSFRRKFA